MGQLAGGPDYAVVSKARARFGRRLARDVALSERPAAIENPLSSIFCLCPGHKSLILPASYIAMH